MSETGPAGQRQLAASPGETRFRPEAGAPGSPDQAPLSVGEQDQINVGFDTAPLHAQAGQGQRAAIPGLYAAGRYLAKQTTEELILYAQAEQLAKDRIRGLRAQQEPQAP